MTSTATGTRRHVQKRRRIRLAALAGAVTAPTIIWLICVPVLGHPLRVTDDTGHEQLEIGAAPVIVLALAAGIAGWASLAVLERLTRRAIPAWTTMALLVLAISFVPLSGPSTSAATRLTLGLMHLAVSAILIPVLIRTSPRSTAGHKHADVR